MAIVAGTRPDKGDSMRKEHVAVPAGALEGELYEPDPTVAPSNPTDSATGGIPAGTYNYKYSHVIMDPVSQQVLAETLPSDAAAVSVTIPVNRKILVGGIAVSTNPHVNGRRLYRNIGGGTYALHSLIADNTTTQITDNTFTVAGNPAPPSTNTTGQGHTINTGVTESAFRLQEAGTDKLRIGSDGIVNLGPLLAVVDRDLTQVDVTSNTNATSIWGTGGGFSLEAGTLGATGGVRFRLFGDFLKNVSGSFVLRVKLGDTTVLETEQFVTSNNSQRALWAIEVWMLNNGSESAQKWGAAFHARRYPTASGATWIIDESDNTDGYDGVGYAASTVDTSEEQVLDITVQNSASSANLSFRKEMLILERIAT